MENSRLPYFRTATPADLDQVVDLYSRDGEYFEITQQAPQELRRFLTDRLSHGELQVGFGFERTV